MTVIAWDGRTLAADKRVSFQGLALTTTKITRANGCLVGLCGDGPSSQQMLEWFRAGAVPEDLPACQRSDDWGSLLVIRPNGAVHKYERGPYPLALEDRAVAIGSGRDFALAAMHCGKSAREAVEIACIYECGCGNGIDTLQLDSCDSAPDSVRNREAELEDLLVSARAIAEREGLDTAWERFSNRLKAAGIGSITAKTFRVLPSDQALARIDRLLAENPAISPETRAGEELEQLISAVEQMEGEL